MKRQSITDDKELSRLDELNTNRVENTRKRVMHAIRLAYNPAECLSESRITDGCVTSFAHAVNLLESAEREMRWACEWFEWNSDVCDMIGTACADFGKTMAFLESDDDDRLICAAGAADHGMSVLGKAAATLVRWFDDSQDVSEI